jgi:TatD DNase family protein
MLETDSPFLAPVPFRGKRCEPSMITHTASTLAEIHKVSASEIAELTTRNAESFFNLCPNHSDLN